MVVVLSLFFLCSNRVDLDLLSIRPDTETRLGQNLADNLKGSTWGNAYVSASWL